MDADIWRVLGGIPWAVPAAFVAVVAAAALAWPVARRTGNTPAATWLLLASIGVIIGVTLTPSAEFASPDSCDLRLTGLTFADLLTFNDRSMNVLLFIPLGVAVVAIRTQHRLAWLLLAASIAPLIEVTQLIAGPLGRTCQAIDLLDNGLGLILGVAAGLAWLGWRRFRGSSPER